MDLSLFDFDLPESLIAQMPIADRTASRLLVVGESLQDCQFKQIEQLLRPNDLLVMNNTKVIAARMFGRKPTGGKVEVMLERIIDDETALVQLRSNKSIKLGQEIIIDSSVRLTVLEQQDRFFLLKCGGAVFADVFSAHGQLPLPPYIKRTPEKIDQRRYQTVYAKQSGAVAAPTAGLHFDQALLAKLKDKGVNSAELTLHVGAGTFQPVRVENIQDHKMHHEWFEIDEELIAAIQQAKQAGGRVVAVGTTSLRALESGYLMNQLKSALAAETDIFIYPGFQFKVVDRLLTNFHLPKSTLMMLVSAFSGRDEVMQAYQHAIDQQYRFFSYGDAMLLTRK